MNGRTAGYERILIATDFSSCSDAAIQHALWIAQKEQSHVVLAHVIADLRRAISRTSYAARLDFLTGSGEQFQHELRQESDKKLRELIQHLGPIELEIQYKTFLGEPYLRLIEAVLTQRYDLVIAGTRGHSAWKRVILGSTARRLVRKCPSDVLITRGRQTTPPRNILVALDMSEVSRRALTHATWLANKVRAELHLLHVIELDGLTDGLFTKAAQLKDLHHEIEHDARRHLEELAREVSADVRTHRYVLWGSPGEKIASMADRVKADLIALGTVGRSGVRGLLLGNTAESVLENSDCDVLTVKPVGFRSPIDPAILQFDQNKLSFGVSNDDPTTVQRAPDLAEGKQISAGR